MSLSFMVTKGKIPLTALKAAVKSGKIKHGKFLEGGKHISDKQAFGIRYSPKGVVWAESDGKGNTMFTEYAGSDGSTDDLMKLLEELEKKYNCEIWDEMAIADGMADEPKPIKKKEGGVKKANTSIHKEIPSAFNHLYRTTRKSVVPTKSKIRTGTTKDEMFSALSSGMLWRK